MSCAYLMNEDQFTALENQQLILQALVDLAFEGCSSRDQQISMNREALGTLFMQTSYAIKDTLTSLRFGNVTIE